MSSATAGTASDRVELWHDPALRGVRHYCDAVVSGEFVFLSGIAALDDAGRVVGPGDVRAQTRYVLERMGATLAAVGSAPEQVLKVTFYFLDAAAAPAVAPIRREFFGTASPASTGVVVAGLLLPGLEVEAEAVACIPAAQ